MKARIIQPRPSAVLYNIKKEDEVISVLKSFDTEINIVGNDKLPQTVGFLAGISGYSDNGGIYDGQGFDCQFMALNGFMGTDNFSKLLSLLKPIDSEILKAMVNPNNRDWTLEQLITEIIREHEAFKSTMKQP